ncbi:hypothetical protein HZS_1878 [Henneguya salminicola]|nr:hypothetical protein HZS_1878 [Henneguya salminicola]
MNFYSYESCKRIQQIFIKQKKEHINLKYRTSEAQQNSECYNGVVGGDFPNLSLLSKVESSNPSKVIYFLTIYGPKFGFCIL